MGETGWFKRSLRLWLIFVIILLDTVASLVMNLTISLKKPKHRIFEDVLEIDIR